MNNYEILGLQKGASISEIKSKFRALSKKYHPDIPGGNASKFISIREAYEALLEGNSGEDEGLEDFIRDMQEKMRKSQERAQWQHQQNYYKQEYGEYRFLGIGKDSNGYRINFFVKNVNRISVYGKDNQLLGVFSARQVCGNVTLNISFVEAEWGKYVFECVLEDDAGGREVLTYKVKPPLKGWKKIINKLKFWK